MGMIAFQTEAGERSPAAILEDMENGTVKKV
jgi:hypothetical protein